MAKKKLTTDEVDYVARLAKLRLTSEEREKFAKQLSAVLEYMEELNEVDTSGVEPTSQTTGLTNILRHDDPSDNGTLSLENALSGTEDTHNSYFKVDAILEKDKNDI